MNAYIFVKLLNLFRFIKITIATLRVDSKIICSVIGLVIWRWRSNVYTVWYLYLPCHEIALLDGNLSVISIMGVDITPYPVQLFSSPLLPWSRLICFTDGDKTRRINTLACALRPPRSVNIRGAQEKKYRRWRYHIRRLTLFIYSCFSPPNTPPQLLSALERTEPATISPSLP